MNRSVKRSSRIARTAVTIAGRRADSTSMFARRSPSQTTSAIARSPARNPMPCHMFAEDRCRMTSNQLKNETMINTIVPPSTSLAPWVSFEMSILRAFLSGDATDPRNHRSDVRRIQLVRCDSSPHRRVTVCPPGLRRVGEEPARGFLALPRHDARLSTARGAVPISEDEREHRREAARALGDEPPPSGRGAALSRASALRGPGRRAPRARRDRRHAHGSGADAPRARGPARAAAATPSPPGPRGWRGPRADDTRSPSPRRAPRRRAAGRRRDGIPSWSASPFASRRNERGVRGRSKLFTQTSVILLAAASIEGGRTLRKEHDG